MKTPGKIAALATSLSLSLALVACGGAASSSASSSAASASDSAAAASSSSAAADSASSSAAADSTSSSSVAASEADAYRNEAFGIGFILPEGWKFADAASIQGTNGTIASATSGASIDMAATNEEAGASLIVAIVEPSNETAGKTAEDFLKGQVDEMEKNLKDNNVSYTADEAEIEFNGLDRKLPANVATITQNGQELTIAQAVAEKDGAFMDIVSLGTSKDEVLNSFSSFRSAAE